MREFQAVRHQVPSRLIVISWCIDEAAYRVVNPAQDAQFDSESPVAASLVHRPCPLGGSLPICQPHEDSAGDEGDVVRLDPDDIIRQVLRFQEMTELLDSLSKMRVHVHGILGCFDGPQTSYR